MYAERKGWELGAVEVEVEVEQGRGSAFEEIDRLTLRIPEPLDDEQREPAAGDRRQVPGAPGAARRDEVVIPDRIESG